MVVKIIQRHLLAERKRISLLYPRFYQRMCDISLGALHTFHFDTLWQESKGLRNLMVSENTEVSPTDPVLRFVEIVQAYSSMAEFKPLDIGVQTEVPQ